MEMSNLTMRVLLLFFPGIVCAMVYDALTVHQKRTMSYFLVLSFVLGMASYTVLFCVEFLFAAIRARGIPASPQLCFFSFVTEEKPRVDFAETFWACLAAFPLALLLTLASSKKWLHKLACGVRICKKFGEIGVWEFSFSSRMPEWVVVRDTQHDRAYEGWVRAFSETVQENEILLQDVRVYENSTSRELFRRGAIYLSFEKRGVIIEFTAVPYNDWGEQEAQEANAKPGDPEDGDPGRDGQEGRGESKALDAEAKGCDATPTTSSNSSTA